MNQKLRLCLVTLLALVGLACSAVSPGARPPATNPGVTPTDVASEPVPLGTTPSKPASPASPVMRDRHQRIFREVWNTVKRNYLYSDYNGTDWMAVREEFAPRVEAATDDPAFWWLMQEMIQRLNDQHSAYLTPEEVAEEDAMASGELDYVGIGVFLVLPEEADYAVVQVPLPGSPAEAAGLRPHDRLLEVNGRPVCCDAEGFDYLYLLSGKEGTTVRLRAQYPGEAPRHLEVTRARVQGQVPVAQRRIVQDGRTIGYLRIPTLWDETIAERSRAAFEALLDEGPLDGLVLDMRINGGGAYTQLYDLLSLFTEGEVGRFLRRGEWSTPMTVKADAIADSQSLPLAVLVGRDTESYAEVFSGALQAAGRATLVGQPTAGNVETVYPYDLEDGSRLWLAEETFEPPTGERWEGQGVQPDLVIPGHWEDFTAEDDPQLDAAVTLLSE